MNLNPEKYPMLTRLHAERIFGIELIENIPTAEFHDGCDECFGEMLTANEIITLAKELLTLAQQISNSDQ